jgi:hypothetical protein
VLLALKDKLRQPGQLAALLPRIPSIALALGKSVQTDMPIDKAIALARTVDQVDLKNPARVVIDNTLGNDRADDPKWGYVLRPDMNKLRAALASVFADLPSGTTAAEAARKAVKSEGAKLVVLNGTPEAGVGASVAAALTADGYNVVSLGNADRGDYTQSRLIVYGDSKPSTREELARRFSVAPANVRWEPTSDTTDLTLIVGQDQAMAKAGP